MTTQRMAGLKTLVRDSTGLTTVTDASGAQAQLRVPPDRTAVSILARGVIPADRSPWCDGDCLNDDGTIQRADGSVIRALYRVNDPDYAAASHDFYVYQERYTQIERVERAVHRMQARLERRGAAIDAVVADLRATGPDAAMDAPCTGPPEALRHEDHYEVKPHALGYTIGAYRAPGLPLRHPELAARFRKALDAEQSTMRCAEAVRAVLDVAIIRVLPKATRGERVRVLVNGHWYSYKAIQYGRSVVFGWQPVRLRWTDYTLEALQGRQAET